MRQFLFITAFAVTMALAASNALAVPADTGPGAAEETVAAGVDMRAPDQQAPAAPTVDLRAPDQQMPASSAPPPAPPVPVDTSDGWPIVVYVLLGVAAAMLFLAGGFLAARMRHRADAVGDDLVPQ